jgi:predicted deacylase
MTIVGFRISDLPAGVHVLDVEACRSTAGPPISWTLLVARGTRPGPTLLATAGVHGDEYEGMEAIRRVVVGLDSTAMSGAFVGLPVTNVPAYHAVTREGVDGLNLARVFPGDPSGSDTERLAEALTTRLMPQADLYCDLHSAGLHYQIVPFAGYCLRADAVGQVQREAAWAFGLDTVWAGPYLPGRSLSAAYERDLPAIYAEMPGGGRCLPEDVDRAVRGLLGLMRYLQILDPPLFPLEPPTFVEDRSSEAAHLQVHHVAEIDGFFRPAVRLGQVVRVGEPFGAIVDDAGRVRQQIACDRTGRVLFLRATPRMDRGTTCGTIIGVAVEPGSTRKESGG